MAITNIKEWACCNSKQELNISVKDDYIEVRRFDLGKPNLAGLQHRTLVEVLCVIKNDETVDKLTRYHSVSHALKLSYANIDNNIPTSCPAPAPAPAKSAANGQGILFVEFQTSGRGKDTEIIEISVVDSSENVLFQSLIKPIKPIKEDSTKQHGINNAHVIDSPSFADVWKSFSAVIGRSDIAFYNADFSKRIILQSIAKAFDTPIPKHFYTLFPYNKVICVGEQYKDFNNFRLGYFRNNGLQHINSACGQSGVLWRDLSKSSSGSAIKSARLYKYLDHKAVA